MGCSVNGRANRPNSSTWSRGVATLRLVAVAVRWVLVTCLVGAISCGARTGLEAPVSTNGPADAGGAEAGLTSPRVLLFGGAYSANLINPANPPTYLGDTWTWDGRRWTQIELVGPSPRLTNDIAAVGSHILLFGGADSTSQPLGDTWDWDGAHWTQVSAQGPTPPRGGAAMAALGGSVFLFGGLGPTYLGDTWKWDGATWAQLPVSGPSPRFDAVAATLGNVIVLYGGENRDILDDTWQWDGNGWTQLQVAGPDAQLLQMGFGGMLQGCAAATRGSEVVMFCDGQTWTWDGTAWTRRADLGSYLAGTGMASMGDDVIMFGGENGVNVVSSTWSWNGSSWTQLGTTGPSPRQVPAMATW